MIKEKDRKNSNVGDCLRIMGLSSYELGKK